MGLKQLRIHKKNSSPIIFYFRHTQNSALISPVCAVKDEGSQMTSLSLLSGYLRLQGRKLSHVLSSGPFLQRLLLALLLTAQLDCSHISLLEDCSIRGLSSSHYLVLFLSLVVDVCLYIKTLIFEEELTDFNKFFVNQSIYKLQTILKSK